jgi:hypothetical protein
MHHYTQIGNAKHFKNKDSMKETIAASSPWGPREMRKQETGCYTEANGRRERKR